MSSPNSLRTTKTLKELSKECLKENEKANTAEVPTVDLVNTIDIASLCIDDANSPEDSTAGSTFTIENSAEYFGAQSSSINEESDSSITASTISTFSPQLQEPVKIEFEENVEHEIFYITDEHTKEELDAGIVPQTRVCIKENVSPKLPANFPLQTYPDKIAIFDKNILKEAPKAAPLNKQDLFDIDIPGSAPKVSASNKQNLFDIDIPGSAPKVAASNKQNVFDIDLLGFAPKVAASNKQNLFDIDLPGSAPKIAASNKQNLFDIDLSGSAPKAVSYKPELMEIDLPGSAPKVASPNKQDLLDIDLPGSSNAPHYSIFKEADSIVLQVPQNSIADSETSLEEGFDDQGSA